MPNVIFPWRCHLQGMWDWYFEVEPLVLISLDHTANSPLDGHPHALSGAWHSAWQPLGFHSARTWDMQKQRKLSRTAAFLSFCWDPAVFPKLPSFSARYLSYSLRTVCSLPEEWARGNPARGFQFSTRVGLAIWKKSTLLFVVVNGYQSMTKWA